MKKQTWIAIVLTVCIIAISALFSQAARDASAQQGVGAWRDDANGYLCFDFRAWGQCFPYTPGYMVIPAETNTPRATATSSSTDSPASPTPTATPTERPTLTALPTMTRTPAPLPTNTPVPVSLTNGGFEDGLNGWSRFTLNGYADWNSEASPPGDSLAVHGGARSVRFLSHYACYRTGVYQTLAVPAGRNVTISAWFLTMGSQRDGLHSAEVGMNSEIAIGADRYGLTDPMTSDVVWKVAHGGDLTGNIGGGYDPVWMPLSLTTRTLSDRLTVFVSADLGKTREGSCMWAFMNLLAFIDDVEVEVAP